MGLSLGIRQDLLLGNTSLSSTSLGEGTGCCAYMKSRWGIVWRLDTSAGVSALTRNSPGWALLPYAQLWFFLCIHSCVFRAETLSSVLVSSSGLICPAGTGAEVRFHQ